jgi:hypothetical protein
MKLIQKILSHGLLIAFFVGVFFLYLYRADLFPQWFGEEAQSVAMMESGKPGQKSPVARDEAPQPIQKAERRRRCSRLEARHRNRWKKRPQRLKLPRRPRHQPVCRQPA